MHGKKIFLLNVDDDLSNEIELLLGVKFKQVLFMTP